MLEQLVWELHCFVFACVFIVYADPKKTQAVPVLSSRARTRWLIAYTLLRNPSLIELRWSRFKSDVLLYAQEQSATSTDYGTVFVHR